MATSSKSGTVAVWDLDKQRLITVMRGVHYGAVTTLCFFVGEPILFSSGSDNAIKMWIFDQSDGNGRLLRSRSGHSAPPQKIRFYTSSSLILSAARDKSFRLFSTVRVRIFNCPLFSAPTPLLQLLVTNPLCNTYFKVDNGEEKISVINLTSTTFFS